MSLVDVKIPDLGEIEEVDVVEILVTPGDRLAKEDSLITLESDKATMDVPAPQAGIVKDLKVKAGDKVREGTVILTLEAEAEPPGPEVEEAIATPAPAPPVPAETASVEAPVAEPAVPESPPPEGSLPETSERPYASPAVRRLARTLGVDLSKVRGSGRKQRILGSDVEVFVKKALSEPRAASGGFALPEMPVIDFSRFGEIERQPLSRIQRISGPRLQAAWITMPHVTQHDEADITELESLRQEHKGRAKEAGFSLTPLAFIMKAVVATLREFPTLNSSLDSDGEHLVLKKYYHLGFAVDTPGGLLVPVIRDAGRKGIFELARELAEVSAKAREGKLGPDQMRGASFTITSLGGIGGTAFTPIINPPEVAILGVSRSRRQPVWQDGEFAPRLILPISLSYDHRVVDGATAVRFTTRLCALLSDLRQLVL